MGMTDRDRKLLAVFAVAIVLGGYWFLILGKKRTAVADAQAAKVAAQQALDAAKQAAQTGLQAKKHYPVSYSRVIRLGKAIPDTTDYASLVVQVNDIANASGVNFASLTSAEGAAATGSTGVTGFVTTCGESGATGASDATATPTPTGATGPTQANTGLGQAINNANAAKRTASADSNSQAGASADVKRCAAAPTLTDLAAVQAGLVLRTFSFKFNGSFFRLHQVLHRLLGLVSVNNGKVTATGRLLQINSIDLQSDSFPDLSADVEMTGYILPAGTSLTAGASPAGPAGAPTSSPAPSAAPGPTPAGSAQ